VKSVAKDLVLLTVVTLPGSGGESREVAFSPLIKMPPTLGSKISH
jgi:hypothetical protein